MKKARWQTVDSEYERYYILWSDWTCENSGPVSSTFAFIVPSTIWCRYTVVLRQHKAKLHVNLRLPEARHLALKAFKEQS